MAPLLPWHPFFPRLVETHLRRLGPPSADLLGISVSPSRVKLAAVTWISVGFRHPNAPISPSTPGLGKQNFRGAQLKPAGGTSTKESGSSRKKRACNHSDSAFELDRQCMIKTAMSADSRTDWVKPPKMISRIGLCP